MIESANTRCERNSGIDMLKVICSFLVVCIHAKSSLSITPYVINVSRIAVPIFFMITGYYYHKGNEGGRKKKIVGIVQLYLIAQCTYFIYEILLSAWIPSRELVNLFTTERIFLFLTVNETTPDSAHLWYLLALIYILTLAYFFDSKLNSTIKMSVSVIVILGSLIFGVYSNVFFGKFYSGGVIRNWLFSGLPYFLLGEFIYDNRDTVEKVIKVNYLRLCLVTLLILCVGLIEFKIVGYIYNLTDGLIYFFTPLLSICVFIIFLYPKRELYYVSLIGRKYSGTIYIAHLIVYEIFSILFRKAGLNTVFSVAAPVLVYIGALIYAYLWEQVKQTLKVLKCTLK